MDKLSLSCLVHLSHSAACSHCGKHLNGYIDLLWCRMNIKKLQVDRKTETDREREREREFITLLIIIDRKGQTGMSYAL